ncbi:protein PLANT CADMIUM RESISTANCE 7-like [Abrus precatorius]|uniref:Protein PLANT CADMIUM RESISTANCE 7-like n=1 Tax=Abrus precatorius TaxID=3816 RepID=A0A8B8KV81_ABRPR|nr:protein PLANT CADMIUM RESISTANCE 7-like [Abrus precatorius]
MYPAVNENDESYATHNNYPAYAQPVVAFPNYGTPQPQPGAPPYIGTSVRGRMTQQWTTGLCHCLDDPGNCLVTCFCPCVTFGLIAEIVDKGTTTCACCGTIYGTLLAFTGLACLYSCSYRSKLRVQYDLPEAPCMDCLVHFCCETCALCQEYRELKNRGFDLSIGWDANVERRRQEVTLAPVISQSMTR